MISFEVEQFEAVRAQLPAAYRPLLTFAFYTGWRWASELLGLRLGQVDVDAGMLRLEVNTTKNDRGRSFPYAQVAELAEIVAAQIASAERIGKETDRIVSHLFFEPDGSPITKHHYWEAFKAARTAAGCPSRTLHDFRRTAVRALVRAGVAESVAMKCTGHLTRSVFDRYDISSGADLNDAGGKLNAYRTSTPAADEQPTAKVIEITQRLDGGVDRVDRIRRGSNRRPERRQVGASSSSRNEREPTI